MNDLEQLRPAFEAVILALHERHVHARRCPGCDRCQAIVNRARRAREDYDAALREAIG